MKNNYFDDFKEGRKRRRKNTQFSINSQFFFVSKSIYIFISSWFIIQFLLRVFAYVFCDMLNNFEWRKAEETSSNFFYDGIYVNLYRLEKASANQKGGESDEKYPKDLFVKQNCNNMPQVSSIKIYISANNERTGRRKISRVTNDSWIDDTNHRRIMTKWFPWELICIFHAKKSNLNAAKVETSGRGKLEWKFCRSYDFHRKCGFSFTFNFKMSEIKICDLGFHKLNFANFQKILLF